MSRANFIPWGFVDPPQPRRTAEGGLVFCNAGSALTVAIQPLSASERKITIIGGQFGTLLCNGSQPSAVTRMFGSDKPLLFNPPGERPEQCASYNQIVLNCSNGC
jgi:hypothetical protein